MRRQADLAQVFTALAAARGFAGRLDGRQQHGHQHAQDRQHGEQLDQREGPPQDVAKPALESGWKWVTSHHSSSWRFERGIAGHEPHGDLAGLPSANVKHDVRLARDS